MLNLMTRPNTVSSVDHAGTTRFGPALTLTSLSTLVAMIAYSGPLGNAPTLTTALDASSAGSTWILSSISLGLAVSLLPVGALADELGRRRVFALGAWVFAAGMLLDAVAGEPGLFVAGRIVQGIGGAGIIATGLGLATAAARTPHERAVVASWWGVSMGAGVATGPLLTGLLDLGGAWRAFYWFLAVAGALTAVAATRWFTEITVESRRPVDLAGSVTMAGTIGLLLITLVEIRQGSAAATLACAAGALACLVLLVLTQLRGRAPMLDAALFRRPDFVAATVGALATGLGVIALMSFACTFLVAAMSLTTLQAAGLLTLWSATSAVFAVLTRYLPAAIGGGWQLVIGLACTGVGMLFLTPLSTTSSASRLVVGLLIAGVGTGVLNAALGRQAVASVPAHRAALGTGINNTARYLGAAVGVTLVSVIAAADPGDTAGLVAGWNHAAVLTGALSLAGAVVAAAAALRHLRHTQAVS